MPPPNPLPALLPEMVLWLMVSVAAGKLLMPWTLLEIVQPLTMRALWLRMAVPFALVIVMPLRTAGWLALTSNTPNWLLPLTVSWSAAGPWMVTPVVMDSSPLVSVMVWPTRLGAKTMVSPLLAAAMSARSEPAPLSLAFVTVSVLSRQR